MTDDYAQNEEAQKAYDAAKRNTEQVILRRIRRELEDLIAMAAKYGHTVKLCALADVSNTRIRNEPVVLVEFIKKRLTEIKQEIKHEEDVRVLRSGDQADDSVSEGINVRPKFGGF